MTIGSDKIPYRWFLKLFIGVDKQRRLIRFGRLVWSRRGGPGTNMRGWSASLSLGLRTIPFALVQN